MKRESVSASVHMRRDHPLPLPISRDDSPVVHDLVDGPFFNQKTYKDI